MCYITRLVMFHLLLLLHFETLVLMIWDFIVYLFIIVGDLLVRFFVLLALFVLKCWIVVCVPVNYY